MLNPESVDIVDRDTVLFTMTDGEGDEVTFKLTKRDSFSLVLSILHRLFHKDNEWVKKRVFRTLDSQTVKEDEVAYRHIRWGLIAGLKEPLDDALKIEVGRNFNGSGKSHFGGADEWPTIRLEADFPVTKNKNEVNRPHRVAENLRYLLEGIWRWQ